MKKLLVSLLFLFVLFPLSVKADNKVTLHLFYGETCPHCKEEEEFLDKYLKGKKDVDLEMYEVWNNKDNQELLVKVQDALDNHESGVPYLVIGDRVIIGYMAGTTDDQIDGAIREYKKVDNYQDVVTKIINNEEIIKPTPKEPKEKDDEFNVPILGKIKGREVSIPLLAVVLGLADGFNPCAMWVLIFLITMLLGMKDRKKMWILGLTFILTSGIIYLLFMVTWLNLATFISKIKIIRILVSLVAFTVGFINLKNFYESTKKDDGCNVVEKKDRKKIMTEIMRITTEKKFLLALGGIILLAASVNIIEMMCSIGLPLIFTQILAMNSLPTSSYALYMFIYIFFFLIDDIVVFIIAMTTLKVTGISTKYNKYSHLVAGIITLLIGLLLLIKPSLLMFNF